MTKKLLALGAMAASLTWAQGVDFSKVEIKADKLADNFYVLNGNGGAIGVLTGPDGVLMVDSQFAPLSDKIVAAIKQVSNGNIRFMINTHVHGDHTGGNENFGKMGVTIIAREELRRRLEHPNANPNGSAGIPMPAPGLPLITYTGSMVFHMDGDTVHVIAVPRAHTDGDTMVYFEKADVLMTGDWFRSIQYPNVDRANGGSLTGLIDALGRAYALCGPNTRVVPGHGKIVNREALIAHRDVVLGVRNKVEALIKEGKSQQDVVAAKPAAEFDPKVLEVGTTEDRFVGQVYLELKGN